MRGAWLALAVLLAGTAHGQYTSNLSAVWVPTDGDAALISSLTNLNVTEPENFISGMSVLGIIPYQVVADWLSQLVSNPSLRSGTVRWVPSAASICTNGVLGCTKSLTITVLEFNYVDISATDCEAFAIVEADTLLPQTSVLTDGSNTFMPPGAPQYQISAAPNSTSGNCTYVVQYPEATQTLANQLCDDSCYSSPCIPCSANVSIGSGSSDFGCTQFSGLPPAIVGAIQGAAQCLAGGTLGRYQCTAAFSQNNSACGQLSCFPSDALVEVEGAGARAMRTLTLGDRVKVALRDGSIAYQEVYFFGHRDATAVSSFVQLRVAADQGIKVLELSPLHFVPLALAAQRREPRWQDHRNTRAKDVAIGDVLWALDEISGHLRPHTVVKVDSVIRSGLWNPYTPSGTIVVGGVVASVHSEWLLDALLDALARPDLLPAAYQVLLWPLRALYAVLGPAAMQRLDGVLGLDSLVRDVRTLDVLAAGIVLAVPFGSLAVLRRSRPSAML